MALLDCIHIDFTRNTGVMPISEKLNFFEKGQYATITRKLSLNQEITMHGGILQVKDKNLSPYAVQPPQAAFGAGGVWRSIFE